MERGRWRGICNCARMSCFLMQRHFRRKIFLFNAISWALSKYTEVLCTEFNIKILISLGQYLEHWHKLSVSEGKTQETETWKFSLKVLTLVLNFYIGANAMWWQIDLFKNSLGYNKINLHYFYYDFAFKRLNRIVILRSHFISPGWQSMWAMMFLYLFSWKTLNCTYIAFKTLL